METPWREDLVEPWYSKIGRQLIVEPIVGPPDGLPDYKFFVFGGRVEFIQMDIDRFTDHRRAFYDRSWRKQEISLGYPKLESLIADPPRYLTAMTEAAEVLGAPFDFVRIDLYDLPDGPRFGGVTFSPMSGFEQFDPPEMDRLFGRLWQRAGELAFKPRTLTHATADDDRTWATRHAPDEALAGFSGAPPTTMTAGLGVRLSRQGPFGRTRLTD